MAAFTDQFTRFDPFNFDPGYLLHRWPVHDSQAMCEFAGIALGRERVDVAAASLPEASWLTVAESAGVRVDRGRHAYLAEWGASRRFAVPDAVRAAVADAGPGGAVFKDVCAHVNRLTQRDVPSGHISQALRGLDLSYDPASRLWGAESSETPA